MKKTLFVLLSAALIGISRLPFHLGWMAFFALVPLLYYFESGKQTWKELVRDAFVFSAVCFSIWMHWIIGVTGPGFAGIILFYLIYYLAAFAAIQTVWHKLPKFRYIGFALIMLTLEQLQNYSEFRFAWVNLGYALSDYTVLLQIADIGGVVLLSLFIVLINIFIYKALQKKPVYLIWTGVLLALWTGYGVWCLKTLHLTKSDEKITVMQPSIPQENKWEEQHFGELYQRYVELSHQAALDSTRLLIWPEAAMPAYVLRETGIKTMVQRVADNYNLDLFTGFPDVRPAPEGYLGGNYYYNAATLFRPYQSNEPPYYKIIIVPVAERMPFLKFLPFMWKLQFGQANWEFGTDIRYYKSGSVTFSPQICFEIAFAELNRKMAFRNLGEGIKGKPDKIDFLCNITNDAWFGRSVGPWIHAVITKYRAVENRVQVYRSANTGYSMAVDPLGRIIAKTKLFDITNLKAPLYRCSKVPLYYYLHGWTLYLCWLTALLLLFAILKRNHPSMTGGGHK